VERKGYPSVMDGWNAKECSTRMIDCDEAKDVIVREVSVYECG